MVQRMTDEQLRTLSDLAGYTHGDPVRLSDWVVPEMARELLKLRARVAELEILVAKSEAKLGSWDL